MYDHVSKALSRTYWQYKNSPKFIQWLKSLPEIAQLSIEEQAEKIQYIIDIDDAVGNQLDICGRIVGFQKRPSFKNMPDCVISLANDDIFRILIKAKIFKNNSMATTDDIKEAIDYLLDIDSRVLDGQDMTMRLVWFKHGVSPIHLKALEDHDLLPRPQGVSLHETRVITYKPFGFGKHNQNFGNSPFWNGGHLYNYRARIRINVSDTGLINGFVTATNSIQLADLDITIKLTDAKGNESYLYTVTDANGQFSVGLNYGMGDFTIIAKTQVITPMCETLNITSKLINQTIQTHAYYITEDFHFQFITEDNEYLIVESKQD